MGHWLTCMTEVARILIGWHGRLSPRSVSIYCGSTSATLGTWLSRPCRPPPIKSQCGKLASARRLGGATLPPRHSHFSTLPLHSVSAPVVSNRLMVAPPPDRRRCCRRRCGLTTPSQRDHYPPRPLRATPFRGARRASACLPSSGRSFHHHAAPPRPSVKRATSPLPPVDRPPFPFLTSLTTTHGKENGIVKPKWREMPHRSPAPHRVVHRVSS